MSHSLAIHHLLGHEGFALFAQPITLALDIEHNGVMEQPIENRGGDDTVASQQVPPLREGFVAGQDDAAGFIPARDDLK